MSSNTGIQVIMGGAGGVFRSKPGPEVPQLLSVLKAHHVDKIDTAVLYGESEEVIGDNNAGEQVVIDTKNPGGFTPGTATKDNVIKLGRESLQKLKVKQVDVLYIHSPDEKIPFEETLDGLDVLYREGVFRRLGVSNFKLGQVEEVFAICEKKGYVKPQVYQGNYNAFARSYEAELLPALRKRGMSFFAYSPQAGGFLSKTNELVESGKGEGRFASSTGNTGPANDLYKALYKKPTLMKGLTRWNEIARDAGLKPGDMAARWVRYDSALKADLGDAIIIGGRTIEQTEQTLQALEQGPLAEGVVKQIDEVWETVKGEAPVDNYHSFMKDALAEK